MLTLRQKNELRRTFALAEPRAADLTRGFYLRLFAALPESRAMFHRDLETQGAKLMEMLALILHWLDCPQLLESTLDDSGRRHAGYGVKPEHYPPVADALVEAMADLLGPDFTGQSESAWRAALQFISLIMIGAADREAPPSAHRP